MNFNRNFYNYINKNKISLKFIQKQKIIYEDNCKNFFINNQNILNIKNNKINDINNFINKLYEKLQKERLFLLNFIDNNLIYNNYIISNYNNIIN